MVNRTLHKIIYFRQLNVLMKCKKKKREHGIRTCWEYDWENRALLPAAAMKGVRFKLIIRFSSRRLPRQMKCKANSGSWLPSELKCQTSTVCSSVHSKTRFPQKRHDSALESYQSPYSTLSATEVVFISILLAYWNIHLKHIGTIKSSHLKWHFPQKKK